MKLLSALLPIVALGQKDDQDVIVNKYWEPAECLRKVTKGDFVRYHYSGFLKDGQYFDDSYHRGTTYNTYVGTGWLIPGMDQALYGMCLREKRLVEIPSELAYGEHGVDGIPGGADLMFNVELVDIWNPSDGTVTEDLKLSEPRCEKPVTAGDYVRYHYDGRLPNGMKFHSSYDEGRTYDVYVGQGWLISGMDEGLIGMCPGDERKITIPPHMAYGEKGDNSNIPGHSSVIFYVNLIDKHHPNDGPEVEILEPVENCTRKTQTSDYIRYYGSGATMDGKVFWENYPDYTWDTYLGYGKLIPGMEKGLLGACTGEKRRIKIPPSWGYGERGSASGKVPPSAVLIFDVRIVDFHNPKDVPTMTLADENQDTTDCELVPDGSILAMKYKAYLENGEVIDNHEELKITFNDGKMVHGLRTLMLKMCMNTRYKTVIPPHYAYGEKGIKDYIPGSAVLNIDVEVNQHWDVIDRKVVALCGDQEPTFAGCDKNENEEISLEELKICFADCRVQGHPWVTNEEAIGEVFEELDANTDGRLKDDEFSLRFPEDHDEL